MKDRLDIKDFILKLESQFFVNDWKFNETHIWPIIRIKIFFYFIDIIEKKTLTSKKASKKKEVKRKTKFYYFKKKIKKILKGVYVIFWIKKLPKKEFLYLSQDNYRVNYKGVRYNRFFDTINDLNNRNDTSLILEEGKQTNLKRYNEKKVFNFEKKLNEYLEYKTFFYKEKSFKKWNSYSDFLSYLKNNNVNEDFINSISQKNFHHWYYNYFFNIQKFFEKCLNKIKPKEVHILCYYYDIAMGLTSISNYKKIPTFEMQHGPQSSIHLAYGSWSKIPKEGYDVLPRNFLCWDNISKRTIDSWGKKNNLYKSILFGNPWVNYWKKANSKYNFNDFIIYTLQPYPFTFEKLFFKELIEIIKLSKKKWFVRLHPRQISQYKLIEKKLIEKNILSDVNLYAATHDPLPLLLSKAFLHVTNFSGTTLEANFFNLKTIFFHKNGKDSFKEFIDDQKAIYIDKNDQEFKSKLLSIINN